MPIRTAGDMLALAMLVIRAWNEGYAVGATGPDTELGSSWADAESYVASHTIFDDCAKLMPGDDDATDDQRKAIEEVCQAIADGVLSPDDLKAIGKFLAARDAGAS